MMKNHIIPPVKKGMPLYYDTIIRHAEIHISSSPLYRSQPCKEARGTWHRKTVNLCPNNFNHPEQGLCIAGGQARGKTAVKDYYTFEREVFDNLAKTEAAGKEKSKLFPQDIGMIVNDFLIENFSEIVDYNFTADVEEQFDKIAEGKLKWTGMLDKFYTPFHKTVEDTLEKKIRKTGVRILGTHPETGEQVSVRMGRFGPVAQIGDTENGGKPRFASLAKKPAP